MTLLSTLPARNLLGQKSSSIAEIIQLCFIFIYLFYLILFFFGGGGGETEFNKKRT